MTRKTKAFTEAERRFVKVLSGGEIHTIEEGSVYLWKDRHDYWRYVITHDGAVERWNRFGKPRNFRGNYRNYWQLLEDRRAQLVKLAALGAT